MPVLVFVQDSKKWLDLAVNTFGVLYKISVQLQFVKQTV